MPEDLTTTALFHLLTGGHPSPGERERALLRLAQAARLRAEADASLRALEDWPGWDARRSSPAEPGEGGAA